ncbi:TetR/AcrR family transcriptional regulator [Mucilaginibacter jinjuensis]|uniref:TetR/AcrR family transcriptional regulator n=1 Tax=Mucilaginibacter jinjuensis TaxID=1176721 RepID=A0ABY7T3N0_9SPHI|nr:TetR/AcrR family transcriptional regulator [Mucilaginibacter jinjuensis]WCT11060.1 TetR/AcrR family transcriptional regulator [Mucilaginibacter jinjuensis]
MTFIPRSAETRQRIVKATAEVFNKKGVSGTSIKDLETATGMTRGSIYGNFENKDSLTVAVFDFNAELKRTLLNNEAGRHQRFKDKLLAHVLLHLPSAKTPFTPGGCPFMNTTIEADDTNELLRDKAGKGLNLWTNDIIAIIEQGIKAKEFKPETDAAGTAIHIISLIEGASLFARSTQNMEYVNRLLDLAKKVINDISLS